MENMSLSDIAAVTRDNDWGNGNGGIWWVLILAVLLFGGGNFGWNNNQNAVTEATLCNSNNFVKLSDAVGRLNDQNQQQTMTINDAVLTSAYQTQSSISDLGSSVALAQANIQTQAATNQGETQRAIDAVKYELAQDMNAINANTTAQIQDVKELIQQNKIDALQARVNQLETENQLAGVVRYPNQTTYGAGWNPFFNPSACSCGAAF